jgi:hypothetical protein
MLSLEVRENLVLSRDATRCTTGFFHPFAADSGKQPNSSPNDGIHDPWWEPLYTDNLHTEIKASKGSLKSKRLVTSEHKAVTPFRYA